MIINAAGFINSVLHYRYGKNITLTLRIITQWNIVIISNKYYFTIYNLQNIKYLIHNYDENKPVKFGTETR